MDACIVRAFAALLSAKDCDFDTSRSGIATRSAAGVAAQEAEDREKLHAIRSCMLEAVDQLTKGRSTVANAFEGPLFRCHKCHNITPELLILPACQHRVCHRCLQSTFDALVVQHVQRISALLPSLLRQPPPVITDDYLKKLDNKNALATLHCPFCSEQIRAPPLKAQMYSDIFDIASACVYIPDNVDASPERASFTSYFREEKAAQPPKVAGR